MKSEDVIDQKSRRLADDKLQSERPLFAPKEILHCYIDAIQQRRRTDRSNPLLDSALPELLLVQEAGDFDRAKLIQTVARLGLDDASSWRSEEHTSELQSHSFI